VSGPFDLVVFDLGGVLVQIARTWDEAHERAGLAGRPPRPSLHERIVEVGVQDGSIQSVEFYRRAAEVSEGRYTPADVRRMSEAWLIGEYPGVDAVFDRLEAAGVETAVLSNTNDAHWRRYIGDTTTQPEFPHASRTRVAVPRGSSSSTTPLPTSPERARRVGLRSRSTTRETLPRSSWLPCDGSRSSSSDD
jgi:beta-phosphoglucomutase-like phosphatase (HAD superfamily)